MTDGVNLLSGTRIASRVLKVTMFDVVHADEFRAAVDGSDIPSTESFCVDPIFQQYEFNVFLPDSMAKGSHAVQIALGKRAFAPVGIEVV